VNSVHLWHSFRTHQCSHNSVEKQIINLLVITVEPRLVDVSDAVVATDVKTTVLSGVPADNDIDAVFKWCA
jgi:NADPH-dependent 7-cyano-7-deazaguanine reductase QueF